MIYLDNAATSFPKPPEVTAAMRHYADKIGASPGRAGHRPAAAASRLVFQARERLAALFGIADSSRIIFTKNVTEALNLVLFGLLEAGDRVLVTGLEHNAVMRPLRRLEKSRGITVDILPMTTAGQPDPAVLENWLTSRRYAFAVLNHGSNVTGSLLDLAAIVPRLRRERITVVVDGAQTAGALPLEVEKIGLDVFCFTGHKSLLGPQGTGGFYLRPGLQPRPLIYGGTGSRSEAEEQPEFLPDYYESGTPNTIGLAGLAAAAAFIERESPAAIHQRELHLVRRLEEGLAAIPGLTVHGPPPAAGDRLPVLSCTIANLSPSEIGLQLERRHGILVRVGLHCAPRAHRTIGTFPTGTVRLAPGYFNTMAEMETVVAALADIAAAAG
ncbi:MAG: aminotransferase class V-fold PLP-dependent enzyme [Deltaproteobacteria bacterium]|nr:aminotransferase class V-fold PLP-dependent enzyme [Deltaproteobacteria bacterium]